MVRKTRPIITYNKTFLICSRRQKSHNIYSAWVAGIVYYVVLHFKHCLAMNMVLLLVWWIYFEKVDADFWIHFTSLLLLFQIKDSEILVYLILTIRVDFIINLWVDDLCKIIIFKTLNITYSLIHVSYSFSIIGHI